ncbi:Lrp/AsnC family transcriptional regulator [Prosthecomicrobium hirschii]|uniref:Lrp/AsnC family transcriptional regulator n=1 Tax=Prosthecodimorpha hirschii TaxID=665126 RepID=UPI0022209CB9|nr:Lrp/AsnC family transcriptional regulator [Prosthecomicrobium hirschii]MCW1838794.1 Lrp/AsnC family transcriptional regulator [Prosthecomicrobium hirschii]
MIALDGYDLRLLAALQTDGRLTNQELAERVHLSASQCSRRRQALEEAGVIRRYRAELDGERLGLGVTAFVNVQLARHSEHNARRFRDVIADCDEVLEAHALTGDMDYLIKIAVRDLKSFADFVNTVLLAHETVAHVTSRIVIETLKSGGALPLRAGSGG